jgi:hypothetical protein
LQVGIALGQFNLNRSPQLSRSEFINWFIETGLVVWPPADLSPPPDLSDRLDASLVVHCASGGSGPLWQYETAAGWRPLLPDQSFYELMPWPDGGLFLGSRQELEDGLQVTFSRYLNGRLIPIHQFQIANPSPNQYPFQYGGLYPGLFFSLHATILFVVDQNDWIPYTADCDDNGCALTQVGGGDHWRLNIWSPDGRYAFVYQDDETVQLIDQAGNPIRELRQVGLISAVQWLDNERFIVAASHSGPQGSNITESVTIGYAAGEQPDRIIPVADLLNDQDANLYLHILPVGNSDLNNNRVILIGERGGPPTSGSPRLLLFSLELEGAEPTLRPLPATTTLYLSAFPFLSPNGRWLTLVSMDDAQTLVEIIDLDNETNWPVDLAEPWIIPDGFWAAPNFSNQPSWSPDGRWLSISHAGIIHLLDPERAEHTVLTPPQPGCMAAAWLSR